MEEARASIALLEMSKGLARNAVRQVAEQQPKRALPIILTRHSGTWSSESVSDKTSLHNAKVPIPRLKPKRKKQVAIRPKPAESDHLMSEEQASRVLLEMSGERVRKALSQMLEDRARKALMEMTEDTDDRLVIDIKEEPRSDNEERVVETQPAISDPAPSESPPPTVYRYIYSTDPHQCRIVASRDVMLQAKHISDNSSFPNADHSGGQSEKAMEINVKQEPVEEDAETSTTANLQETNEKPSLPRQIPNEFDPGVVIKSEPLDPEEHNVSFPKFKELFAIQEKLTQVPSVSDSVINDREKCSDDGERRTSASCSKTPRIVLTPRKTKPKSKSRVSPKSSTGKNVKKKTILEEILHIPGKPVKDADDESQVTLHMCEHCNSLVPTQDWASHKNSNSDGKTCEGQLKLGMCQFCSKIFKDRRSLKRHIKSHTDYQLPASPDSKGEFPGCSSNAGRRPVRPIDREKMRPWLERILDTEVFFDVKWVDHDKKIFEIPWKHAASRFWSVEKDGGIFELWAVHTRKYIRGKDTIKDPKRWKANFRCALNSLPDLERVKVSETKGFRAVRRYRFLTKQEMMAKMKTMKSVSPTYLSSSTDDPHHVDQSLKSEMETDEEEESTQEHPTISNAVIQNLPTVVFEDGLLDSSQE